MLLAPANGGVLGGVEMSVAQRRLVYLLYGGHSGYRQEAKYSLLSLLRQTPRSACPQVLLYTDRPEDFEGWPVDVEVLDNERLERWTGNQAYLHRRKAEAVLDALKLPGTSIFVDTDTFFVAPASELFERLEASDWLVDEIEGRWGQWRGEHLYAATADQLNNSYGIEDNLLLINSGVLALRKEPIACMEMAIRLIDEVYPMAPDVHVIEQFAVSCAAYMKQLGVPAEAQGVVKHYYGDKLFWRQMITEFFARHGETFSDRLVASSAEMPLIRPKPTLLKRLFFRMCASGLDKHARKIARAAFFALHMPGSRYAQRCAPVYALDCLKAMGAAEREHERPNTWQKCFTASQLKRLDKLLEQARRLG